MAMSYLPEAHESLNRALGVAFSAIEPGLPVVFGHPEGTQGLPAECWRVYWLDHGQAEGSEMVGMVQVDVFARKAPDALRRASKLSDFIGLGPDLGTAWLAVTDFRQDPPRQVGQMRIVALERGWVRIPDPKPSVVHLARTLIPRWRPGTGRTIHL